MKGSTMRLTGTPLLLLSLLAALAPSVQAVAPTIAVAPAAVTFTYGNDGKLPVAQLIQVTTNPVGGSVTIAVVGTAAPWLVLTPPSGTAPVKLSLRVNPSGLAARTYSATLNVSSAGAVDAVITVTLVVKGTPPTLIPIPASATFNLVTGMPVSPLKTSFSIGSSGLAVSLTLKSSAATWLKLSADAGLAVAGAPFNFDVSIDSTVAATMVPKSYAATISVTSSDTSVKSFTIPVTLVISQGLPTVATVYPGQFAPNSTNAIITVSGTNYFGTSIVRIGSSDLSATSVTYVSATTLLVAVPSSVLAVPGTYEVTVRNGGIVSNIQSLVVLAPGPVIGAVANVGSYNPKVSPGTIVSIFGSGLGPADLTPGTVAGGLYPTTIAGTTVEFQTAANGWVTAPLIFVRADQINAVVPFTAAPPVPPGGSNILVKVTVGTASHSLSVPYIATDPAAFTMNGSGTGQAIVLNQSSSGVDLNSKENAAEKGTIIVIYLTGGGALTPATVDGTVIAVPAPKTTLLPTVMVDGKTCDATGATGYSGSVVGSIAGLVQINCTLDAAQPPNPAAPLLVTYGGLASPAGVTIAIK